MLLPGLAELRSPSTYVAAALAISLILGGLPSVIGETDGGQYRFDIIRLRRYDVFMMVVSPPPSNLRAEVEQVIGNRHTLVVRSNESTPIVDRTSYIPSPMSLIQLGADGEIYNVTMRFSSQSPLWIYYGALTFYPTANYPGQMYYRYGDAYFVIFGPVMNIPAGNVTFSMLIQFEVRQDGSTDGLIPFLPSISLPPFMNAVLFTVVVAAVAYVESYFLLSFYFQHRSSGLSSTKKALALASVVVAAAAIVWSYNTFLR